ncbi:MAG TPA: TerC/Alx family metal homeostasis membrane protein [Acidimicrobiales bacterium]
MDVSVWAWIGVVGFILAMLVVDLLVLHRGSQVISVRNAVNESILWIALGVGFGVLVWSLAGGERGGEYFAGYLTEKVLSVDNMFLFSAIFAAFAVPAAYQHRVLLWGVVGALATRAVLVTGGATLLAEFSWAIDAFGVLLLVVAARMAAHHRPVRDPKQLGILRLVRRVVPSTAEFSGPRFVVRETRRDGRTRWLITPLLVALFAIEATDVVFAVDSVPAVFGITSEPFLVFTSIAFAVVGLRALYFLLAAAMARLVYLRFGLAAILGFVGVKMLLSRVYHLPVWVSLLVIVVVLLVTWAASVWRARPGTRETDGGGAPGRVRADARIDTASRARTGISGPVRPNG